MVSHLCSSMKYTTAGAGLLTPIIMPIFHRLRPPDMTPSVCPLVAAVMHVQPVEQVRLLVGSRNEADMENWRSRKITFIKVTKLRSHLFSYGLLTKNAL